ncbi:hypothetical protein [Cupriavidus basilensis]|uniref:hypothetical protein n=2 Tax=Cupriavidus TaxID=106589 RepID=UPI000750B939|nr:hypothetical protein [Cupriavidus basilensis]
MTKRTVAVNDQGMRIGEDHPRAKLTDADVERMLQLRAEGIGYKRLAAIFECSPSCVRYIVKGLRRGQPAMGWRVVESG